MKIKQFDKSNLKLLAVLGLSESHLDQKFRLGGQTFKLSGFNPRAALAPFRLLCMEDGKTYCANKEQVKQALDKACWRTLGVRG